VTRKSIKIALVYLIVCTLLMSGGVFVQAAEVQAGDLNDADYIQSVMDMVIDRYKGEIDRQKLLEGALKGLFSTMDPYTTFYTKEEAQTFFQSINGTFIGVGIAFTEVDGKFIIEQVYSSSPAEEAGLMVGDIIVEVDRRSMVGRSLEEVSFFLLGEEGTKVTIGIRRDGKSEVIRYELIRREVRIEPVTYKIDGKIGYIKLDSFNSNACEAVDKALDHMNKNGITKIVLDLRDNPGGEVNQAVLIARRFVPEGLITKLDFKSESMKDESYYSYLKEPKYKLVVLVNRRSASASEILAGAIQDTGAGTLVGTKTFGKGKVQNLFPILTPEASEKYGQKFGVSFIDAQELNSKHNIYPSDDEIIGWIKITTGEYYTPNGRMIDGEGIDPDVYVDNPDSVKNGIQLERIGKLRKVTKPGLNDESKEVLTAESILMFAGYDVDEPDNFMDEKTVKAVAQFQKDCGLYSYGVLDFATQQALNDKLDELLKNKDLQYLKAIELLSGGQ